MLKVVSDNIIGDVTANFSQVLGSVLTYLQADEMTEKKSNL